MFRSFHLDERVSCDGTFFSPNNTRIYVRDVEMMGVIGDRGRDKNESGEQPGLTLARLTS